MTLDLPAIRARAEAATPGPWSLQESNQGGAILLRGLENDNRLRRHPQSHLQVVPEADAVFVAHAREDVPALLAEVERLSRNLELASAECCDLSAYRQLVREEHPAEVAALTAEVERLRERVRRVALWVVDEVDPDMNEDDKQQLANEALEATRG